ncbi:pseudouridine synthase [Aestuariicoccus sp. MJ-SS9]|uniref:pseudouridine synthase n=1 Tax=Aestuariicoccus sp. MJ-SS9 TaxID=3079855 RepID=UPI0029114288|nr:pseudouridine synthase [Aestuariicoccus sp. MJ-SS9]MDU8909852.1 pseudouridine synthase [Aestuariicoccus sp. MJ-SS9]
MAQPRNPSSPPGDRIAKVLARAGVASRREAERMIEAGRVAVNGKVIDRAALNVTEADKITVDGKPLDAPEEPRLWLYHKPTGLVTTTKDEQGRPTIYDDLPEDLPRVMSVGRLDLNSEGLLLLTNDGGIKRRLELPSTGWLRRYRVRVKGRPTDDTFTPLREGLVVDGQRFQPMIVSLDRQQGANAWLTVGLREGKNREIRRAMTDLGLTVNRLIRLSYGPFQLGQLKPGEVQEVRRKIVRDQLGLDGAKPDRPKVERRRKSRNAPPDKR